VSPGEEALREAARLETARIYSQILAEPPADGRAEADESALAAALWRLDDETATRQAVTAAIRAGKTTSAIVAEVAVTYSEVRAIRKQLMRGAAGPPVVAPVRYSA
jgi:hypothetical protein